MLQAAKIRRIVHVGTQAKQMPIASPEIPAANHIAADAAGFEAPRYLVGDGYSSIRMDDGTYQRIEKILPPDPLALDYVKPEPQLEQPDQKESHSKSFERLLDLSRRAILYVENHIVHSRPKYESNYETLNNWLGRITLPDGRKVIIQKTPPEDAQGI